MGLLCLGEDVGDDVDDDIDVDIDGEVSDTMIVEPDDANDVLLLLLSLVVPSPRGDVEEPEFEFVSFFNDTALPVVVVVVADESFTLSPPILTARHDVVKT